MLFLFAKAGDDEHHNGHHKGEHFHQRLGRQVNVDIVGENVKCAEDVRAGDGHIRLPDDKEIRQTD